jgi:hypothetical protein
VRPRRRWQDNIEMYHKETEIGPESSGSVQMQWRSFGSIKMEGIS